MSHLPTLSVESSVSCGLAESQPATSSTRSPPIHQRPATNSILLFGARGSSPDDSDSDILDISQIIKTSDIVRQHLEHGHYQNGDIDSNSASSDDDDGMVVNTGMSSTASPGIIGDQTRIRRQSFGSSILRWDPSFLKGGTSKLSRQQPVSPSGSAKVPAPSSVAGGVLHSELACDKELLAILAETDPHYYPLRKRSEKNMHPYTKLVWTNPDELHASNGKRRDLSILEEPSISGTRGSNTVHDSLRVDPEDSEDEEYIPGMLDKAGNDTQTMDPHIDAESLLPLVEHRQGLTYRHLAARRRQQLGRPPRKRPRSDNQSPGASSISRRQDDGDHLPSVSSILGLRHSGDSAETSEKSMDDPSDPFGVPPSGDIHGKSLAAINSVVRRVRLDNEGDQARNDMSMRQLGRQEPLFTTSSGSVGPNTLEQQPSPSPEPCSSDADASSSISVTEPKRQRRLLPRSRYDAVSLASPAELPASALPTSRARKLNKLSRNQIRGILPFSFMRDLSRDKNQAIQEEVDRWMHSGSKGPSKRRILPSSPSGSDSEQAKDQALFNLGDDYAQAANDVSEMFSDLAIPSPRVSSATAMATHRSLFSFNLVDIYEWQYPPLAPVGSVDRAPDFLRVAAREARRQGVYAKSVPDDPSKKAIFIHPRCIAECGAEDIAQSILLSWNLGVIDLRRVYFSNEYDDSDSDNELEAYPMTAEHYDNGWSADDLLATNAPEFEPESIVLSDDGSEAAEDNTVSIMSLGRSHPSSGPKRRPRATGSSAKRQINLFGSLNRPARSRNSRKTATIYSPRSASRAQPAAHKLTSVMNEFAALDSDSETSQGIGDDNVGSRSALGTGHQRRVRQPQGLPSMNSSYLGRHGNMPHASKGQVRRASLHSTDDNQRRDTTRAEFLFDDEQVRSVGQWRQSSPKRLQTKFLPSRPVPRPSSVSVSGDRGASSKLDTVISRIVKQQLKLVVNPRRATTQRRSRKSAPIRNFQPAAVPTRVHMRNTAYSNTRVVAEANRATCYGLEPESMPIEDMPTYSLPAAFIGDQSDLSRLASGTRFDNGMWISQGGICRVQRMFYCAYCLGANSQDSSASLLPAVDDEHDGGYQYLDILRIDITATPVEFIQAYSMLFILWYEIIGNNTESHQTSSVSDAEVSVFRWIEYSQHYIASKARSKADLSQLAQRLTSCVRDNLVRLSRLAGKGKFDRGLAASMVLSFSVSMMQLALVFGGAILAQSSLGPRAVGEEDELDSQWSVDRFKTEVDSCLKVAVMLLMADGSVRHQKTQRLGPMEQIWATLMHLFPGNPPGSSTPNASTGEWSAMAIMPISGVWPAVLQASTSNANNDRLLAARLWSAVVYLLPLTRLNSEGIAAPHSNRLCHKALLQLVEAATEKQLVGIERDSGDGQTMRLRPSEELGIRQTYFRIHGVVVDEDIGVGPGSSLYMTLYRYLESRRFCSLSIEPPPSLPRFFTRYTGTMERASESSDTCTMLWLKALDKSLGEWIVQLKVAPPASKEHRRTLRDVRSTVSKLLPTVILTFDNSTVGSHLSTLANYYSVFIFFLHAIPSDVVRSTRLYTQLQSMLRFKESSNLTARRVYFEAWSAATTIIALNLRRALEECGSSATRVVELLIAPDTIATDAVAQANVKDYYGALKMAVGGWSESLSVVEAECTASSRQPIGGDMAPAAALWGLADSAMMYLTRVLTSTAITEHTPTVLLLVLSALKSPPVLKLVTGSEVIAHPGMHVPLLKRLMTVLGAWQRAVTATARTDTRVDVADGTLNGGQMVVAPAVDDDDVGEDSQMDFAMFNSMDLLDIAAEAAELERRAPFAVIDAAILLVIHEQYIPGLRQHITQTFFSLSSRSTADSSGQRHHLRALELTVRILVHMVSACVDAGLRTWESFLDEYGRDSLYLIPDSYGRRLVLAQFAVSAIDVTRRKGQRLERLDVLLKDVWFASVCDLRLIVYVEQLAAQLAWADEKAVALAVFSGALPVLQQCRLVSQDQGTLRDCEMDRDIDVVRVWHQNAAPLAVSLIGRVLKNMAAYDGVGAGMYQQVFASWVVRLLSTQQEVQAESRRRMHGVNDTRKLVDTMAERVAILVRDNCAAHVLPPNLMLPTTSTVQR